MKVQPEYPLVSFTGHVKGSKISFYVRNGKLLGRTITQRKHPGTKDQLTVLRFQAQAVRHYRNLTIAQFAAWDDYARKHHPAPGLTGFQLFTRVQFLRQCLALPLSTDAPTLPPPTRVIKFTPQPAAAPDQFQYRITHDISVPAGHTIRFDITAAMPTPACAPRDPELRMIRHIGPDSFLPLQPSGALYTIPDARFAIPPGARYGLRVTLLTPDAVPGPPLTTDLIR